MAEGGRAAERLLAELASVLGSEAVGGEADRAAYAVDGLTPGVVLFPASVEQVAAVLKVASEAGLCVVPSGRGAFLGLGHPPRRYDVALSVRRLDEPIHHEPDDMTVTAPGGAALTRLQEALGRFGQWLPVDPPLEERVTVGGLVAAALSGPLRLSQGTVRDLLLGLVVVQADGSVVKGGGKVVKNVAGYDLPRLYCGSLGTLGVVVEATFKVRPRPKEMRIVAVSLPSIEAGVELALAICGCEMEPLFVELEQAELGPGGVELYAGFGGVSEEVAYQLERLRAVAAGREVRVMAPAEGEREHARLRDYPARPGADLACKVSLPPAGLAGFLAEVREEAALRGLSAGFVARAGNGILYLRFSGAGDASGLLSLLDWLRVVAKRLGGYVVVEAVRAGLKDRIDVWGYAEGALVLMKTLKEKLDPKGTLSPGRFVGKI
jgi:glycolate oxidase FAD binding subunit